MSLMAWFRQIALLAFGAIAAFYLLVALGVTIAARIRAGRTPDTAISPSITASHRRPSTMPLNVAVRSKPLWPLSRSPPQSSRSASSL